MMEVGKNALHPDFDRHLIDHWPGESFSFELDYPEDAPTREIAGKRVQFDIIVRELKEKVLPDLNDELPGRPVPLIPWMHSGKKSAGKSRSARMRRAGPRSESRSWIACFSPWSSIFLPGS